MKLSLMSHDSDLQKALEQTEFFQVDVIYRLQETIDSDVLVISDQEMTYNELISLLENDRKGWLKEKKLFYLLSDFYSEQKLHNLMSLSKTKHIMIIPPKLSVSQITQKIVKKLFPQLNETNQNIITFFGADGKVGTTMVAHSTAEILAENTKMNIGLFFLNGRPGTCYMKRKEKTRLDDIKIKLINNILTSDELLGTCEKERERLYILPGVEDVLEVRHYQPEHIERLIQLAAEKLQIIIIDAGSNIDSGMTIAALQATKKKYLVTTQQEVVRKNYERIDMQVFRRLQIDSSDFMLVVNKYIKSNRIYSAKEIADLYRMTLAASIPHLDFMGWQAEFDHKTLLHYENEVYNRQIEQLSRLIAAQVQVPYLEKENKKTGWFRKAFSQIGGFV